MYALFIEYLQTVAHLFLSNLVSSESKVLKFQGSQDSMLNYALKVDGVEHYGDINHVEELPVILEELQS